MAPLKGIRVLQRKYDESAALLQKAWLEIETLRTLSIQLQQERKRRIKKAKSSRIRKRKTSN